VSVRARIPLHWTAQYAQRFFRPIQELSEKFNILQAAMASSERQIFLSSTD
jgi:ATP-binding cassette subfamily B multidrug efflux pump